MKNRKAVEPHTDFKQHGQVALAIKRAERKHCGIDFLVMVTIVTR